MKPQIVLAVLSFTSSLIAFITATPVSATEPQDSSTEIPNISKFSIKSNLPNVTNEESALSGSAAAIEAKLKTVEDMKAFEASKAEASASLRAKLENFQSSLSEAEQSTLVSLLEFEDSSSPFKSVPRPDDAVFLKPQQSH